MLPLLLSDLKLTFGQSPWFFALLGIAAIVFAVVVYRYTLPPIDRLRRTVLWTLRGLALVLILLMIFEPVLNFIQQRREQPTVAVLVDRSASVGTAVERGSREAAINSILSSGAMRSIGERSHLRMYAFADSVQEMSLDSLSKFAATGVGTDLAQAWERATKAAATENLGGIVILSDGANNSGANPERAASDSRIPLYTIGIGDTTERPDALIAELLTNDVTYVGSKVPVDIRVRAGGLKSAASRFRLLAGPGRVVHEEMVNFRDDPSEAIIHAIFDATQTGEVRLTAVIDSVAGETLLENNRRSVIINVLETRAQVVILSGPPTADLSALRQVLASDSTLDVKLSVELGQGKKLRGSVDVDAKLFDSVKLIVMCNYPSAFTTNSEAAAVAKAIQDRRIPVLYLAGGQISATGLSLFQDVIPVRMAKQTLAADRVVLRESASHPAVTGASPLPAEWSTLPPVTGGPGNFTVESGVQVIAKLSREALGLQENEPAVAVWDLHQRRGAAILIWNSANWKLQLATHASAVEFYHQLFARLSRWLVAPADEKRFVVRTDKKLYTGGERVGFTGQVYGADLQPRDDAVIDLKVTAAGRTETVPMRNRGNGRYEGQLSAWGEGDYEFQAQALAGVDTLGKDRGLFAVEAFNIELLASRARFDVLRSIAQRAGGQFTTAQGADALLRSLKLEPREVDRKRDIPLWNQATMLWVIIGLLAAEWIIRKRSGML